MGLFGSLIDLFRSRHFDIKWQVNTAAANDSTIASALFRCRALIKIISDTCVISTRLLWEKVAVLFNPLTASYVHASIVMNV